MDVNSINFYLAIFLLVLRKQLIVAMMCPYKCSCPDEPTHCPNNEALVSDGCDCCMVCSRQLGQPCNNIYICDPTKGLSCRYSMSSLDTEYGVCTAMRRQACSHEGHIIAHGQSWTKGCKEQCYCIDGITTCKPLCPSVLVKPANCQFPELKPPKTNECCLRWVCNDENEPDYYSFYNDYGEISNSLENKVIDVEDSGNNGDELDYQIEHFLNSQNSKEAFNLQAYESGRNSFKTNFLPSDIHEYKDIKKDCKRQDSGWTKCSKTCDTGTSVRVTNDNPQCRLVRIQRLCNVRPCKKSKESDFPVERTCNKYLTPKKKTHITYNHCKSIKKVATRLCGLCHKDTKKSCEPLKTRTQTIDLVCPDNSIEQHKFMVVKTCSCSKINSRINKYRSSYKKRQKGLKLNARENVYNVR